MLVEIARWLFVIVGATGLVGLAGFLGLLFVTVGQGFWMGIRLANDPQRDRIQRHYIWHRMHLLTWVFYTGFVCIVIAKVLQYFLRDHL